MSEPREINNNVPGKRKTRAFAVAALLAACCALPQREPGREFPAATETALLLYRSGVLAAAGGGNINGAVHYKIYRLPTNQRGPRRVRTCYVQHGIVVSEKLMDLGRASFDRFVQGYYGTHLIGALLKTVCSEVIAAMQESNVTTILEMTRRTERFMKDVVCHPGRVVEGSPSRIRCALIGHSKGGAVAFNIARRCMTMTSELGEPGCRSLGEIYSANGSIQGAQMAFTAYGARVLRLDGSPMTPAENTTGCLIDYFWNIYGEYEPGRTSPMYVGAGPVAPMESGVPLAAINDVVLRKTGWLVADFAATATGFVFSGKEKQSLYGCRRGCACWNFNGFVCTAFGYLFGEAQRDNYRRAYDRGLEAMRRDRRFRDPRDGSADYLRGMSWETQRQNDGLVDLPLALAACRKGLAVKEKRAVRSCKVFKKLNHMAALNGPEAVRNIIAELGE